MNPFYVEQGLTCLVAVVWCPALVVVSLVSADEEALAHQGMSRRWVGPVLNTAAVIGVLIVAAGAVSWILLPRTEKPLMALMAGVLLAAFAVLARTGLARRGPSAGRTGRVPGRQRDALTGVTTRTVISGYPVARRQGKCDEDFGA